MKNEKDEIHFHNFLEEIREYRGVTIEQLCSGLCSVSQMHYIQSGARLPDYLMRNRIMARLGISSEGYEDYIHYDEYERWCLRQQLIELVENSKWCKAELLLFEIEDKWKKNNKIEQQFMLDMKARLYRHKGATYEELFHIYEEIVNLTIDSLFDSKKRKYLLSQVEYFYVINFVFYKYKSGMCSQHETLDEFKTIIESIISSPLEGVARAKVLPFAVIKFYEALENTKQSYNYIWNYSNSAMEVLKETERSYYLMELVSVRREMIEATRMVYDISLEEQVVSIIEHMSNEYFVKIPMWQNGYIYRDSQVSCIANVIHSRRRMFNMSRKQLADGICSVRTLERIEAKKTKPQYYVMCALFERLNLVGEYRRAEIITPDIQLINKFNRYKEAVNQKKYLEATHISEYIAKNLCKKYVSNKQAIIRMKNTIEYYTRKIDKQIFTNNLEKALGLSFSAEKLNYEHCYLTNGEIVILHNINLHDNDNDWCKKALESFFNNIDKDAFYSYFSIFELVKDWQASSFGNDGMFEASNEISVEIIKSSLRLCKIHGLYRALANIAWNDYHKKRNEESGIRYNELLVKCINLCDFSSNKLAEVYRKELKK